MTLPSHDRRAVLAGIGLTAAAIGAAGPVLGATTVKPILVFDIVETILDTSALAPVFETIFGDSTLLRTWFDELIVYSEAMTITGAYQDAGKVGVAVLDMMAKSRGVTVSSDHLAAFRAASASLPAYPDVAPGLLDLKRAGYRLVTLSNSPLAACDTQLKNAGIRADFERLFSIDEQVRRFKPAPETYRAVAQALGADSGDLLLVSCHAFDVMGAAAAGLRSALILRPGNAPFGIGPQPDLVVRDLATLARALASPLPPRPQTGDMRR